VQPSTVVTFRVIPGAGDPVLGEHVEEFWLPVLGPSAYLLARLIVTEGCDGLDLELTYRDIADALGVSPTKARNAIHRLCRFGPVTREGRVILVPDGWPEAPEPHYRPASS
jgi:hypothetical protein